MVKVFGHKSPDTDTVLSAIIYSWFLNQKGTEAKPYVLGEINNETRYVLDQFGFEVPDLLESVSSEDQVAIVDTSNNDELFENIAETEIVSFVDHHKLAGNIATAKPLEITVRPLAATASVLYWLIDREGLMDKLTDEICRLIVACIISDTLLFRSPTTTDYDKQVAEELAKRCDINLEELAQGMFDAKSDLSGMSVRDILDMDSKVYEIKGKSLKISVVETTKPSNTLEKLSEISTEIDVIKASEDVDEVLLFVIDIINEEATAFGQSESAKELVSAAFNNSAWDENQCIVLPGVLSRKKQIVPALEA